MAIVDGSIQIAKNNSAWFTANSTVVLLKGQLVFNETTSELFIGDGTTQLSALTPINSGVTQTLQQVLTNGNSTGDLTIVSPDGKSTLYVNDGSVESNYTDGSTINSVGVNSVGVTLGSEDGTDISFISIKSSTINLASNNVQKNGIEVATINDILINKTTTGGTLVTGTTSNTLSSSLLIPANSISVGDIIELNLRIVASGNNNNRTCRIYFNTSASLSGATLAGTYTAGPVGLSFDMSRDFAVKSATNTEFFAATASLLSKSSQSTIAISSLNIDWTVDQYVIVAIQLTSGLDAAYSSFIKVSK